MVKMMRKTFIARRGGVVNGELLGLIRLAAGR